MNKNYERAPTRGEIYFVSRGATTGSEQQAGRPAIVVSNEMCNIHSPTVEMVYLTSQPKTDLPTHVTIRSTPRQSTALCEQIMTIDASRLQDYIATCTAQEMTLIDAALMISLGIDVPEQTIKEVPKEVIKEVPVEVIKEVIKEVPVAADNSAELIAVKAQLQQLQTMYNELLRHSVPCANPEPEPRRTRTFYEREMEKMNALATEGTVGKKIEFTYADKRTAANAAKVLRNHTSVNDHLKIGYRGNTVTIEKTK